MRWRRRARWPSSVGRVLVGQQLLDALHAGERERRGLEIAEPSVLDVEQRLLPRLVASDERLA